MTSTIRVKKRDGRYEPLDYDKIHVVLKMACDGLDASVSDILVNTKINFYDKISTVDIHSVLINTVGTMITENRPDYAIVAGRLLNFDLRKQVYGKIEPDPLYDVIKRGVAKGLYHKELLKMYTPGEWEEIGNIVDHERDFDYPIAAMSVYLDKYLVKDRSTGEFIETPQYANILISAVSMHKYARKIDGVDYTWIKKTYNKLKVGNSLFPTPLMAGVRSSIKQFSSCFPAGQQVYTSNGNKNIEDVNIDDNVLTIGSTYEPVYNISNKLYSGNIISMNNDYSISNDFKCTAEHLIRSIKLRKSDGKKQYKGNNAIMSGIPNWYRADELHIGDLVHIPFDKEIINDEYVKISDYVNIDLLNGYELCNDNKYRRINKSYNNYNNTYTPQYDTRVAPIDNNIKLDGNLLRLLGYYLAEGHCNKNDSTIGFTLNINEIDYHNDIINLAKTVFNIDATIHYNNVDNSAKISINNNIIKYFILSLCGTGFNTKYLNNTVIKSKPEYQKQLLIGVIRGDGCCIASGIQLNMSNHDLIHQISHIMLRCGLYPSLGKLDMKKANMTKKTGVYKRDIIGKHDSYRITLGKSSNQAFIKEVGKSLDKIMFTTENDINYSKGRYIDGEYYAMICKIQSDYADNIIVYDLSVTNDPSFTVSGVGVHNCVTLSAGDSLDSINAAANSIVKYAAKRAGLGVSMGRVRAEGSKIKGGLATTTGIIPFTRYLAGALKSCSQGGLRGSAATFNYPIWHREAQDLLVLKNNKGTQDTRIRVIDYCFAWNKYLVLRAIQKQPISLFCPHDVSELGKHGDLFAAFYGKDINIFAEIYEKYENDKSIKRVTVDNGWELLSTYLIERDETGRLYALFADTVNERSQFMDPVELTNLCTEICLAVIPDESPQNQNGLISLCTLGGVNMMTNDDDLEESVEIVVRALDAIIDYQEYETPSAERSTKLYRPLGIGLVNYAYWMAKNDFHNPDNLFVMRDKLHEFMEKFYYYALKASVKLAAEYGKCPGYDRLQYSNGKLNIDFRNKALDDLAPHRLKLDWDWLREQQKLYGVRNAQLLAIMPTETSSLIPNATNGVDLIRDYIVEKECKGYAAKFVAPELKKLKHKYKKAFDMTNKEFCEVQLINMAIMQQYVCQAISTNTYSYPNSKGKVEFGDMFEKFMYAMTYGLKTLYYNHINKDKLASDADNSIQHEVDVIEDDNKSSACDSGACAL